MVKSKEAVVVLLHKNSEVFLLQMRDFSPHIILPGHWGCFGGGLQPSESVMDGARRELAEEIKYCPDDIEEYRSFYGDGQTLHVCHAELKVPLSRLQLCEGMDMGLFTAEEIISGRLYSFKLKKDFPVSPPLIVVIKDYLEFIYSCKR